MIGGRANTGRVDVDELRITKGALPVANFLHRYANGALADGDAYLYLPLDGDRRSIACMDDVVALTAYDSAPAYATNVLERRICEWGDWSVQLPRTRLRPGARSSV